VVLSEFNDQIDGAGCGEANPKLNPLMGLDDNQIAWTLTICPSLASPNPFTPILSTDFIN
jgi:hypothetical protein